MGLEQPMPAVPVIESSSSLLVAASSTQELLFKTFKDAPVMVRVAGAESTYCKDKINQHSSARGCFQILKDTWKEEGCVGDPMNDIDNMICARKIYDEKGTKPWNSSRAKWGK